LEKHGVPLSFASRKISMISMSDAATGLSMKTGFFAAKTGFACCG